MSRLKKRTFDSNSKFELELIGEVMVGVIVQELYKAFVVKVVTSKVAVVKVVTTKAIAVIKAIRLCLDFVKLIQQVITITRSWLISFKFITQDSIQSLPLTFIKKQRLMD